MTQRDELIAKLLLLGFEQHVETPHYYLDRPDAEVFAGVALPFDGSYPAYFVGGIHMPWLDASYDTVLDLIVAGLNAHSSGGVHD